MYFIEKTTEFDKWLTQQKDIEKAKNIWNKLKKQKNGNIKI